MFAEAIESYLQEFKLSIIFGVLLVFVLFFMMFSINFISSGSIFFEFNLKQIDFASLLVIAIVSFIFIALYSLFITLVIFNAKQHARIATFYLEDKIRGFIAKNIIFYVLLILISALIAIALLSMQFNPMAVSIILLIFNLLFFFVPQAIIIDERSIGESLAKNFDFIISRFPTFIVVILIACILLSFIPLIEFAFDFVYFTGKYISIIFTLIFLIPFIEILKTKAYINKFDLLKF